MGKLIMPKQSADLNEMEAVLKVYNDSSGWLDNRSYIERIKKIIGGDLEPQAYTKKTQILSYFGFTIWKNLSSSQSERGITDSGKRFYEGLIKKDNEIIFKEIMHSLQSLTFGRNVCGCASDSDIEPPILFIRCVLVLGYITRQEYGFILWRMDVFSDNLFELLTIISKNRLTKNSRYQDTPGKYNDAKPITVLLNWGFFIKNNVIDSQDKIEINKIVLDDYLEDLVKLSVYNNVEKEFTIINELKRVLLGYNIIYFGAPGTGKSHTVDALTKEIDKKFVGKVTFHPEYDHASFVGCYKPISANDDIKYEFSPQVFIDMYIKAWNDSMNTYYIVIDEINRGNCAEIFGDLFQLLDREDDGSSKYEITPNEDLKKYLVAEFGGNLKGIANGRMRIPANLVILATMNTSDQSLYPMDSAFKRRWDWVYIPIIYTESFERDGIMEINDSYYFEVLLEEERTFKWIEFIEKVNENIKVNRNLGADKQIGNYFIKPKEILENTDDKKEFEKITLENFIHKVMFYLWNDVFKDEEDSIFGKNTYQDLFPIKDKGLKVIEDILDTLTVKYTKEKED